MKKMPLYTLILVALIGVSISVAGQQVYTPAPHLSAPWKVWFSERTAPCLNSKYPAADDTSSWSRVHDNIEIKGLTRSGAAISKYKPEITYDTICDVAVVDIQPAGKAEPEKIIVYLHGGAYTLLSAYSSLHVSALVAHTTHCRVIAVDYTCAPKGNWQLIIAQAKAVIGYLIKTHGGKAIAVFGDSAGGGLALACVLSMQSENLPLPGALLLWSPWCDLAGTGDSYMSMKDEDPLLCYENFLLPSALAYAQGEDLKNPYISPVYADYSSGFPPTLIQGGSREILLSDFLLLYQAMAVSDNIVKLDLYDGLVHDFQVQLPESNEAKDALETMLVFLKRHLK